MRPTQQSGFRTSPKKNGEARNLVLMPKATTNKQTNKQTKKNESEKLVTSTEILHVILDDLTVSYDDDLIYEDVVVFISFLVFSL